MCGAADQDIRSTPMSSGGNQANWKVIIKLEAAGPIRPRNKHKKHKLLRSEGSISLPFVPYPGLYLTFSKPRKRGDPMSLYLRIRTVEWNVSEQYFDCFADEVGGSLIFSETYEVRGPVRIEKHYSELQEALQAFGFDVLTDVDSVSMALHKQADGTVIGQNGPIR